MGFVSETIDNIKEDVYRHYGDEVEEYIHIGVVMYLANNAASIRIKDIAEYFNTNEGKVSSLKKIATPQRMYKIRHLIDRYGYKRVKGNYFKVSSINKSNVSEKSKKDILQYYSLYRMFDNHSLKEAETEIINNIIEIIILSQGYKNKKEYLKHNSRLKYKKEVIDKAKMIYDKKKREAF